MTVKPKLVICDVDGTLIDPTQRITPYFDELAELLHTGGVRFTLASGRSTAQMQQYMDKLDIREPVLINNGAGARQAGKALWDETFDAMCVKRAILKANEMDMAIFMCEGDDELIYRHNAYIQHEIDEFQRYNHFYIPLEREWPQLRFEKVMITDPKKPGFVDEVLPQLEAFRSQLNVYRYDDRHLDIVKKGVSKGGAILRLAKLLGIAPEEIMAIGDSLNDMEMFQTVGLGVAVGNAKPELKARAGYCCERSYTAGVIEAVKKFCMQ